MNALGLPKPQVDPLLDPSDALLDSSQIAVHRLCVCATKPRSHTSSTSPGASEHRDASAHACTPRSFLAVLKPGAEHSDHPDLRGVFDR